MVWSAHLCHFVSRDCMTCSNDSIEKPVVAQCRPWGKEENPCVNRMTACLMHLAAELAVLFTGKLPSQIQQKCKLRRVCMLAAAMIFHGTSLPASRPQSSLSASNHHHNFGSLKHLGRTLDKVISGLRGVLRRSKGITAHGRQTM